MKWFVYLLSCYILVLSCLPCSDAGVHTGRQTMQTVQQAADSHTLPHQQQEDLCSPFCFCSCCNIQAAPQAPFLFNFIDPRPSLSYSLLYVSPLTAVSDNIWQPPRMG